jgi:hypothetical protein
MNILVGVLGGIVTVLLFFRGLAELGINRSDLNPLLWHRRKQWKKQYNTNPIYNIESPMEMAALLLVAVAKSDGDISAAKKFAILALFTDEFHLCNKDAAALLIASVYLLQDGSELRNNLKRALQKSLLSFTREQATSALSMIDRVADLDINANPEKKELVAKIKEHLHRQEK